ncbi:DNA mismatch endonuclease Vsr [Burkholderia pseudomallei]|uniref:very short patch repair endonuclease n=1 Tax=Burkholderia pseudomallei TaxID=28450 RepID=UPI000F066C2A|nr:very short patch repair endonuclease [Burkholderia pseudomallei]CAJ2744689.1 DNA mismatch endonuclease Vsr [Burkholderia pseudomallei]VCJ93300.1 DNA mismatch endonuclease Vsr [Burkholderia pseudomallei]VCJ94748.1 DNA mismatch endonuclease Vsr [Burkholderia pseudomallei]VCJ95814.1 DNA mismatch endonuclease Vsr [Burkholderia pseudomallei]VCJ97199.1 DNA mismatch endonuclease Vsr [Burkholderia pseudomallei]
MDSVSPARRSEIMGRVRSRDTKPEMTVRRLVHAMGYRYRLYVQGLPGRPDLVFPRRHKVIFVHGCFWHRHPGCALARLPKSREEFWLTKLEANRRRDIKNERALQDDGWGVLIIWECELGSAAGLANKIKEFLDA